jgi:hypothetical protein
LATDANIRLNEWEDSFTPETITDEEHVVHQFETGLYGIVLNEVPDRAFPITINDGSIDLDEVSPAVPPGPNEFRRPPTPKYKYFPRINMHSSRNGETVYATYRGLGSAVNAQTIRDLTLSVLAGGTIPGSLIVTGDLTVSGSIVGGEFEELVYENTLSSASATLADADIDSSHPYYFITGRVIVTDYTSTQARIQFNNGAITSFDMWSVVFGASGSGSAGNCSLHAAAAIDNGFAEFGALVRIQTGINRIIKSNFIYSYDGSDASLMKGGQIVGVLDDTATVIDNILINTQSSTFEAGSTVKIYKAVMRL